MTFILLGTGAAMSKAINIKSYTLKAYAAKEKSKGANNSTSDYKRNIEDLCNQIRNADEQMRNMWQK